MPDIDVPDCMRATYAEQVRAAAAEITAALARG